MNSKSESERLTPGGTDAQSWINVGVGHLDERRFPEAVAAFKRATELAPTSGETYFRLGDTLALIGEDRAAYNALETARSLGFAHPRLWLRLAELAFKLGDLQAMLSHAQLALDAQPGSPEALLLRGSAAACGGMPDDGLGEALKTAPELADALSGIGIYLQNAGRFKEARNLYSHWIGVDPRETAAYFGLFYSGRADREMLPLVKQAEILSEDAGMFWKKRWMLLFALGKAHDDLGNYARAMFCFDSAHLLHKENSDLPPFNREAYRGAVETVRRICTPELLQQATSYGVDSSQPIFVVGMLRSGTTLTEQILSCHPDVGGAGEQGFFLDYKTPGSFRPDFFDNFEPAKLRPLAQAYLANLNRICPGKMRIVDKLPGNATVAGIIHLAFPNAKIVHIRRHPIDTCLSVWTTPNRTPPSWANDKSDIAFVYGLHHEICEYWKSVVPASAFAEFRYEDLVTNTEGTVRAILEFCGLPWSDACLSHDKNRRMVSTPSIWQVRQPMYTSSLRRRDNYREVLGPFGELSQERDEDFGG